MGSHRSLTKLARKLNLSVGSLKLWSSEFSWQQRLEERERDIVAAMKKSSIQVEADTRLRNRQLLQLALVQIAREPDPLQRYFPVLSGHGVDVARGDAVVERLDRLPRQRRALGDLTRQEP